MITDFRHTCVLVKKLDRALHFYRDLLGFKVTKVLSLKGVYPEKIFDIKGIKLTYVKLRAPGQSRRSEPAFELHCWHRPKAIPQKNYAHIALTVKGLDREYKRLRKAGVRFISPPLDSPDGRIRLCFAYDPDGNLIEFMEDLSRR